VNLIGVSPIGWTNDGIVSLGDHIPFDQFLREAKAIGFEGVELGRKFPREPGRLKAALEEYGLSLISGWHSGKLAERSVKAELAAAEGHLSLLTAMGSDFVVYGEVGRAPAGSAVPLSQRPHLAESEWADYCRRVTEFAERVNERGLRLAFHAHVFTAVETEEELERLVAMTGPAVGLVYDSGHMKLAGADPLAVIRGCMERVIHVHLKDVRADVAKRVRNEDMNFNDAILEGVFTTPGDGEIDFGPIVGVLKEADYKGWLVVEAEQDPNKANPYEYSKLAHQHITGLLQGRAS
jgi:inosose dehydratase